MKSKSVKLYVPYHVNPAIIKGYLSRLPKDQLILHGRYIRMRAWNEKAGSNKRSMFVSLYQHCRLLFIEKFRD